MRLATRTGLAAFIAATIAVLVVGIVLSGVFTRVLVNRTDTLLEERAESARVVVAVGDRLARSELSATLPGTRVVADDEVLTVGRFPRQPLPLPTEPGWATVRAGGQRWRLHTVEVLDVPDGGDRALVQMAAPLGRVDAQARRVRRWAWFLGLLAAGGAGVIGAVLGAVAARPMTALRRDTARLDDGSPDRWRVGDRYGSVEVDDVARTLNDTLARLGRETHRRGAALESARAFAASASHELRVPLQGALTNLNMAAGGRLDPTELQQVIRSAADQVAKTSNALAAVRALAEAEFADPADFESTDLAELVEATVAAETGRHTGTEIAVVDHGGQPGPGSERTWVWPAGVTLAVGNVVRNAVTHAVPPNGSPARIAVSIDGPTVTVDDNGGGIAPGDRSRLVERFERGGAAAGTGLGLAIARQVTIAHGGSIEIGDSPLGGARVRLRFAPPDPRE